MKNICVVCEYGWIIKGELVQSDMDELTLTCASVVRKWNNGKGIGGISKATSAKEYTLDPIGDVSIKQNKILFKIPCEW